MNTTQTGQKAETAASVYLEMRGYKILERNWRRPRCEIDIIAQKDGVIFFVEVKYRNKDGQGSGLDFVTATKVKQMRRAAWAWVDETKYKGHYQLAAVELAGQEFAVLSFIENVL